MGPIENRRASEQRWGHGHSRSQTHEGWLRENVPDQPPRTLRAHVDPSPAPRVGRPRRQRLVHGVPVHSQGRVRLEQSERRNGVRALVLLRAIQTREHSLHPGAVQTDLARYLIGEEKFQSMKENGFSNWKDKVLMEGLANFVKTVQEGASTQVFVASADMGPERAGKYFADGKVVPVQAFATDPAQGAALWAASENLAGVKFDL